MEIIHFDQLPQGGFAGLKEKQFVKDQSVFTRKPNDKAVNGIGNFVYLADANFMPHGETGMHGHREIDVISVMVEGNISHAGSLEHGKSISAGAVQIQRAGGEGFQHNEINPDNVENQMIQLWVLPEQSGSAAGYKVYQPQTNQLTQVYGGNNEQNDTFASQTSIQVANTEQGAVIKQKGKAMVYISKGTGSINGKEIKARTLVRVNDGLTFIANQSAQIIVVSELV